MGMGWKVLHDAKPYLAMVLLQVGFAGMYIIAVASLKAGMSHFVLVVHRNLVATAVMMPFALYFERGRRPKMTTTIFLKIAGLAILEPVIDQNLYFLGAKMTSAGFATALLNTLPAVTFVLALLLRMEKVRLRSLHSQAKIAGTVLTVAGAVLMILYHGPIVQFLWARGQHHPTVGDQGAVGAAAAQDWLKGTIMLIGSCMVWSGFFILHGAVALVAERANSHVWVIGFDNRLLTVVYAGIVCSGVAYYLQGVVSRQRGPVFVTAFNPLCMIITAVMGSIILKEEINLGSVIGAVIIVVGLYFLIWGKSKDDISRVSDVSVKVAGELPLTSLTNGHGHGKQHELGNSNGDHGALDVETPTTNVHYFLPHSL
ncbi:hypothetical protein ZWY2020_022788 [Hordeum vulgare]|nr:hypothetical protein ZWY2020_022788 [Hordeum vulgare]